MKKILLINGSPKGKKAASFAILKYLESKLPEAGCRVISVKDYHAKPEEMDGLVSSATDIVISFPLYVDCIPAVTQYFLEEVKEIRRENPANLYVIVNCGFPEGEQAETALNIMQCFAQGRGFTWKRGIGIGMGGMINPGMIPPKNGMVRHIYGDLENFALDLAGKVPGRPLSGIGLLTPKFKFMTSGLIKRLYRFLAGMQWNSLGRKNRIQHSLGYKPYGVDANRSDPILPGEY